MLAFEHCKRKFQVVFCSYFSTHSTLWVWIANKFKSKFDNITAAFLFLIFEVPTIPWICYKRIFHKWMYIKDVVKIILRRIYQNIFFSVHVGIFQIPCFLYFLILTSGPTLVYIQQDLTKNKNNVKLWNNQNHLGCSRVDALSELSLTYNHFVSCKLCLSLDIQIEALDLSFLKKKNICLLACLFINRKRHELLEHLPALLGLYKPGWNLE